jgi:hypothetical protein
MRVLLVSDNEQRLAVWRRAIETADAPWRVESFSGYGQAMLRSARLGPHCLVMDAEADSVIGATVRCFISRSAPQARALWLGDACAVSALPSPADTRALQLRLADIARQGLWPVH